MMNPYYIDLGEMTYEEKKKYKEILKEKALVESESGRQLRMEADQLPDVLQDRGRDN